MNPFKTAIIAAGIATVCAAICLIISLSFYTIDRYIVWKKLHPGYSWNDIPIDNVALKDYAAWKIIEYMAKPGHWMRNRFHHGATVTEKDLAKADIRSFWEQNKLPKYYEINFTPRPRMAVACDLVGDIFLYTYDKGIWVLTKDNEAIKSPK